MYGKPTATPCASCFSRRSNEMSRTAVTGSVVLAVACSVVLLSPPVRAQELSRLVSDATNVEELALDGHASVVQEGPQGEKVLRVDGRASGRIDLKAKGIEPRDYDLLKVEVKADRAASLRFSLENYPNPGELSHWYVLDGMRGGFDWRTIWIDLRFPEEIKAAGTYKGMAAKDPELRGLQFTADVGDTRRAAQGPGRNIWIGRIRFCKKAVDLDWDQSKAPCTWEKGKDLVFTYPLTVANHLDREVTARLSLLPFQTKHATARLAQDAVRLGAGETKTIEACRIRR
jgi:hypothetical protein